MTIDPLRSLARRTGLTAGRPTLVVHSARPALSPAASSALRGRRERSGLPMPAAVLPELPRPEPETFVAACGRLTRRSQARLELLETSPRTYAAALLRDAAADAADRAIIEAFAAGSGQGMRKAG